MKVLLVNNGTPEDAGLIPMMLNLEDERPARDQLDANYQHGGGWRPMGKFKARRDGSLQYPGDPAIEPLAVMHFRDELVLVYPYGFVGIFQQDGSFEVARMD